MKIIFLLLMIVIVAILCVSLFSFLHLTLRNDRATRYTSEKAPKKLQNYIRQTEEMEKEIRAINRQPMEITSADGFKLRGNLYTMHPGTKTVVLALHGYHGGDLYDMARFLPMYGRLGYDCLIPQMRCHGESEGRFITFGFREQVDAIGWCRKLEHIYGEDVRIILHGVSMGGTTALLMSGNRMLPGTVCACVADSAPDSMDHLMEWRLRKYPKPIRRCVIGLMDLWFNLLAHVDIKDISSLKTNPNATIPALFIHSVDDHLVPIIMYHDNRESWGSSAGGFTVTGVPHANAYVKEPEDYEKRFRELCEQAQR